MITIVSFMMYPDLQKHILSLFFPEKDHLAESYHLLSFDGNQIKQVKRRMSISQYLSFFLCLIHRIHLSPTNSDSSPEAISLIQVNVWLNNRYLINRRHPFHLIQLLLKRLIHLKKIYRLFNLIQVRMMMMMILMLLLWWMN